MHDEWYNAFSTKLSTDWIKLTISKSYLLFVAAFQQFIDRIRDDLFVNKKAFSMSFLLDKFCSVLPPNIANMHWDQSNGALIEWVFTQIYSDVLTEPQAEAFIYASTGSNCSKFILLLDMCSPVKFAHSLSKKSRTVSSWELCIICQISCDDTLSKAREKGKCTLFKAVGLRKDDVHRRHMSKNESDIVWLAISDKLKCLHRYKNWYKTILNSTQNKNKIYHKTNLNNNIKLQIMHNFSDLLRWYSI
jgi:hypothetical protein